MLDYVQNSLLIRIPLNLKENLADEWLRINRAQPVITQRVISCEMRGDLGILFWWGCESSRQVTSQSHSHLWWTLRIQKGTKWKNIVSLWLFIRNYLSDKCMYFHTYMRRPRRRIWNFALQFWSATWPIELPVSISALIGWCIITYFLLTRLAHREKNQTKQNLEVQHKIRLVNHTPWINRQIVRKFG